MLQYFIMSMMKLTFGSQTVPSTTLSPKFWLILAIGIFFMQVDFVTSISQSPFATKPLNFSEIIHEFCLRFAMVPNFVPAATHG